MSPARTLAFLCAVLALLALLGQALPEEGLRLGPFTLRMPRAQDVLFPQKQARVDISDILAVRADSIASDTAHVEAVATLEEDSLRAPIAFDAGKLPPLEERIRLHLPARGSAVL
ncbi:MAG: hypothetical protein ACK4L7_11685, partial [Flavobacteriales bacterium]